MIESKIKNEYKLGIRKGITELDDCFYIPVRITGIGQTLRNKDNEVITADRMKSEFMTPSALEHYKTLPILDEHPADGGLLTPENLKNNPIVGNCVDAWIQNNEVWGLARVIDKNVLKKIKNKKTLSTSPGISIFYDIITPEKQNEVPISINHLAFCKKGHWDQNVGSVGFDDSTYERITYIEEKEESMNDVLLDDSAESLEDINTVDEIEDINTVDEIEDIDTVDEIEEVSATDAETEVIDSDKETKEDKKRDNVCDQMRTICDSAHTSLNVYMPHIAGRQTYRSVVNKFLQANPQFVASKYRNLSMFSLTDELAEEVLNDSFESIKQASNALDKNSGINGYVSTGRGYAVNSGFGWANRKE